MGPLLVPVEVLPVSFAAHFRRRGYCIRNFGARVEDNQMENLEFPLDHNLLMGSMLRWEKTPDQAWTSSEACYDRYLEFVAH